MVNFHPKSKGFIAILSLMIVTMVSMMIGIALLMSGVDNAALSVSSIHFENAKLDATVCLEDSLIRVKRENEFAQNLSYEIADGHSCSSTIQWFTPVQTGVGRQETLVNLQISGTSSNFTRTFDYALKVKRVEVNHTDGTVEYTNGIDIISVQEVTS
jgi:hypothetical protein